MCVYECVSLCVCGYMEAFYVYMHRCVYLSMFEYASVCVSVCMSACVNVSLCVHNSACTCLYIDTRVYLHASVHVCISHVNTLLSCVLMCIYLNASDTCIHLCICLCVCARMGTFVCTCVHMFMPVCTYMFCTDLYIYTCMMHTYTHMHTSVCKPTCVGTQYAHTALSLYSCVYMYRLISMCASLWWHV